MIMIESLTIRGALMCSCTLHGGGARGWSACILPRAASFHYSMRCAGRGRPFGDLFSPNRLPSPRLKPVGLKPVSCGAPPAFGRSLGAPAGGAVPGGRAGAPATGALPGGRAGAPGCAPFAEAPGGGPGTTLDCCADGEGMDVGLGAPPDGERSLSLIHI